LDADIGKKTRLYARSAKFPPRTVRNHVLPGNGGRGGGGGGGGPVGALLLKGSYVTELRKGGRKVS